MFTLAIYMGFPEPNRNCELFSWQKHPEAPKMEIPKSWRFLSSMIFRISFWGDFQVPFYTTEL